MTARTGTREAKCRYCGEWIKTGTAVCTHHTDLVDLEPEALAICTVSEDCLATVDGHMLECPVEQALQEEFGF